MVSRFSGGQGYSSGPYTAARGWTGVRKIPSYGFKVGIGKTQCFAVQLGHKLGSERPCADGSRVGCGYRYRRGW